MTRRWPAIGALLLLTVLAGCTGPFGGGIDTDRADEAVDYDWETETNTTLTVERDRILAVYAIDNRSTVEVYGFRRFNNERPIDPVGVRFRYPNGTVVGSDAMSFSTANSRTVIELPARDGQLGLVLPKTGKHVRVPVVVEGSHEVVLPENAHVRYFLLGRVVPEEDDRFDGPDGRVHLRWDAVDRDPLIVEYYLERDFVIFVVMLMLAGVGLLAGLVYFSLQLRTLRDRRQQVAWEDESGP